MLKPVELAETLPALQRLALAYCPGEAWLPTLALLAFDARLAEIVRSTSEPMLAQIRLAWWRDMLAKRPEHWPEGEPLLSCLRGWEPELAALVSLVDGWEVMTGPAPLVAAELDRFASARGGAFGALAALLGRDGERDTASRMGRNWALADIGSRVSDPSERDCARGLANGADWQTSRLSRALRPLTVLHGLACRSHRKGKPLDALSVTALLPAMRLGLLGV